MNMMLGFMCMFVLALAMMNVQSQAKNNEIESKAEFVITVVWSPESDADVDVYVEDPQNNLVFFKRREDGLMHLNRDDQGHVNDMVVTTDGRIVYNENRETVMIRGFIPGEYVVNVHMYRGGFKPIDVIVRLDKIRPATTTVVTKSVVLNYDGDEKTVFRFIVDKAGEVTNINEISKRFVLEK
jgi:hypothetical protein